MAATETEVVALNLEGNFAAQASSMAAGADKLTASMDKMNAAMGAVKGPNIGGSSPFSSASDADFGRSKWEGWKPLAASQPKAPGAAPKAGGASPSGSDSASGFTLDLGKNLKFVAKQAGISKAALAALGTAALFEASKLALGYRGMALLQGITMRTSLAIRQLFRGVDPMPLVRAYDSFTRLFSKSSATGIYLTGLFSRVFNALFGGIEKAEPAAEQLFKRLIIGAQQIEIAWLQMRIALVPITSALDDMLPSIDAIGDALGGWSNPVSDTRDVVVSLSGALNEVAGIVYKISRMLPALPESVKNFAADIGRAAVNPLTGALQQASRTGAPKKPAAGPGPDLFGEHGPIEVPLPPTSAPNVGGAAPVTSGKASGAAYGDGVAAGMRSRLGDVSAAGGDLAGGADAGFRKAAKINSPSRLAYDSAGWYPAGIVDAFSDARGDVQDAADRNLVPKMSSAGAFGGAGVAAGTRAASASAGAAGAAVGGASQVTIQHVWPSGVESAKRAQIEEAAFAGTLRALALSLAVPVSP